MRSSMRNWCNPFDEELVRWAWANHPKTILAISEAEDRGDDNYVLRCLGMLVRRRAEADCQWFFTATAEHPKEVLSLSPWIRQIVLFGYPHPRKPEQWAEWIDGICRADFSQFTVDKAGAGR